MKKLLFILVLLSAFNTNAQLVVKEAAKDTIIWQYSKMTPVPKLVRFTLEGEQTYTVYYRNAKYTAITDIQYISTGDLETTKQFFQLCKSVLDTGKEYTVELDGKSISVKKTMNSVMISESGSYFYLNEKWVDQIIEKL
jgi:hypothetical protein